MVNKHGGDTYGRKIKLDFSANLNPLGMPESVRNAAVSAAADSAGYPDPYCRDLVKKLSLHESIDAEKIVCGNGADDLIYRIVHALRPGRAVIAVPTFSEYAKALNEVNCQVAEYAADKITDVLSDDVDILILCDPNNPTGQITDPDRLKNICKKCAEKNIVFLCDECFMDLCENAEKYTARQFMTDNMIVLKAFTKTFAMAGLRLGYALFGSTETARKVRESGQFWSVSAVAQAAGIAALDEKKYVSDAVKLIREERKYLHDELSKTGFTVCPSDANFILFRCEVPLDELLLGEGIMKRNCNNYSGLGEGYFRIAVRTREENEELIKAIGRVMEWQKK